MSHWHLHPGVRSGAQLTLGERAADRMRNGMGSWGFVFGALAFLGLWILVAETRLVTIDNPQLTILNLVLSCVAALQGAILLIAAKRSDQISSELAQHDYAINTEAAEILRTLRSDFAQLQQQHAAQGRELAAIREHLAAPSTHTVTVAGAASSEQIAAAVRQAATRQRA